MGPTVKNGIQGKRLHSKDVEIYTMTKKCLNTVSCLGKFETLRKHCVLMDSGYFLVFCGNVYFGYLWP